MADNSTKRFTFDPDKDNQEMPTLTSLIYGKKPTPGTGTPATQEGAFTLEPTRALDRNALLKELAAMPTPGAAESPASAIPASTPENADQVLSDFYKESRLETSTPAEGTARAFGLAKPSSWRADSGEYLDPHPGNDLSRFNSPFASVVTHLIQGKKITSAILFEATKLSAGALVAVHAVEAGDRHSLWLGTHFRPEFFSDLWGRLQKFGYSEYSPVGLASQAHSFDRSAVRIAFGCEPKEWITLILQPKLAASQLLLVFSSASIAAALPNALDRTGPSEPASTFRPPAPPKSRAA